MFKYLTQNVAGFSFNAQNTELKVEQNIERATETPTGMLKLVVLIIEISVINANLFVIYVSWDTV